MSKKIIGVTVGTTISPSKMKKELQPVQTINGVGPNENGDIQIEGSVSEGPALARIDGTEAADGSVTIVHTFADGTTETIEIPADENGNPVKLIVDGTETPMTWTVEEAAEKTEVTTE